MPNGKPSDHPIHDILEHRMPVFGGDLDGEIVRIAQEFGEKGIRRLEAFSRTPAFAECLEHASVT